MKRPYRVVSQDGSYNLGVYPARSPLEAIQRARWKHHLHRQFPLCAFLNRAQGWAQRGQKPVLDLRPPAMTVRKVGPNQELCVPVKPMSEPVNPWVEMLEDDGFVLVGRITLQPPARFLVHFDRPEAQSWVPAIYAFRIGGEVVRIGKTESALSNRMGEWERGVSQALAGEFRKGSTNPWEAFEWRRRLIQHGQGEFLAQIGPADKALLKGRERELIKKHNPPLCNDSPRARQRPAEARSVKDVAAAKAYWQRLNRPST